MKDGKNFFGNHSKRKLHNEKVTKKIQRFSYMISSFCCIFLTITTIIIIIIHEFKSVKMFLFNLKMIICIKREGSSNSLKLFIWMHNKRTRRRTHAVSENRMQTVTAKEAPTYTHICLYLSLVLVLDYIYICKNCLYYINLLEGKSEVSLEFVGFEIKENFTILIFLIFPFIFFLTNLRWFSRV